MQGQQLVVFGGERADPAPPLADGAGAAPEQAAGGDDEEPDEEPVEPIADVCALDAEALFWVSLPMDGDSLPIQCRDLQLPGVTIAVAVPAGQGAQREGALPMYGVMMLMAGGAARSTRGTAVCRGVCPELHVTRATLCARAGMDGCKQVPARAGPSLTALPDGRGLVFGAHPLCSKPLTAGGSPAGRGVATLAADSPRGLLSLSPSPPMCWATLTPAQTLQQAGSPQGSCYVRMPASSCDARCCAPANLAG